MSQEGQVARLKITGMHCGGCANSVRTALAGVEGVSSATVSLEEGTASVEYDGAVCSTGALLAAVEARQFGAELLA
jgi:copper chaperone